VIFFTAKDAKGRKDFQEGGNDMVDIEAIARDVVDCAIKVHKALGPALAGIGVSALSRV